MTRDLLLEIGLEEVPARFVRGAMEQLKEKLEKWLAEARIHHGVVQAYATPRRIAVIVKDMAEKQTDMQEEAKGPSRKIAQDAEGNWSKAALGFARSQGVEPDQLYFKELSGVEYVYATKSSIGVESSSLLPQGLNGLVSSMSFPKNMRWGSQEFRFVRPIRWLIALLGQDVIELEIAGVTAGRISRGHRTLGADAAIGEPAEYVEKLREQHVIVDVEERQAMIVSGIQALMADKGWHVAMKEDLLEEVLFLVEYPTALHGSFDPQFLQIPQEVLITSMREHQRYFPVMDEAGKLLPHFVTVRNGDSRSIELVARGNEKVLRARLSDAKFFYEEDHKLTIDYAMSKLRNVVYHEELGTVSDKVDRIAAVAKGLAEQLKLDAQASANIQRAASICKFDLVSQMVYEFPELQGIMGEDYAKRAGESEDVAKAINEHYQPRFAGDQVPSGVTGAIVSLADKIDTIVGCFSIGIVPTGSQDPYALRRSAAGIVQIMLAFGFKLELTDLYRTALSVHASRGLKRPADEIEKDLNEFFSLRVKNWLSEQGYRYDVIDAVMASGISDLQLTASRAAAVAAGVNGKDKAAFKLTVEAFNRVSNLAGKATTRSVDRQLFQENVEQELYDAWLAQEETFRTALADKNAAAALQSLSALKPPIHQYFESVMVMAEDDHIRNNRLATLANIADDISLVADFSKVVW
ncbi:glycine--tRNA ligase subunit beta [Paenibacillus sp. J5C_2022]|uniref:glycine--tRNA ligase subunit beta n=1 Tax=Paenibacillus sp. J5C2022 TaxID=2977129 RepID=UPI0021D18695|nr:glycine--tRNA ligase subunit beta [Paenibacillus sp. J5C2022]MCU6707685.1 glycine--tRNA ligase subunit beta [Paenibacillus sp. J5C2022]